jgi:hypothetical protein
LKIDNFLTVIPFEKLGKMSPLLKLKPWTSNNKIKYKGG